MKILGVSGFGIRSFQLEAEDLRGDTRVLAVVHAVDGRNALDDARRMAIALGYEPSDAEVRHDAASWARIGVGLGSAEEAGDTAALFVGAATEAHAREGHAGTLAECESATCRAAAFANGEGRA